MKFIFTDCYSEYLLVLTTSKYGLIKWFEDETNDDKRKFSKELQDKLWKERLRIVQIMPHPKERCFREEYGDHIILCDCGNCTESKTICEY